MRLLFSLFAVLAIWSGSTISHAQDGDSPTLPVGQEIRIEHLTTEDGLSESRVWGITRDRRGFMWFAT